MDEDFSPGAPEPGGCDSDGMCPAHAAGATGGQRALEVLAEVEAFAAASEGFGQAWNGYLRQAADGACAQLAGQRMAGAEDGAVSAASILAVPVPHGLVPSEVFAAFGFALMREVSARLEVMGRSAPGGLG